MFKRIISLFLVLPFLAQAQFDFNMDVIEVCDSGQVIEVSTFPSGLNFVDFSINNFDTVPVITDDIHTGLIDIDFSFDFYGQPYTEVVISTNGYLSFNDANAGTGSQWSINSTIPNAANGDAQNSIMAPYTDSEPGPGSELIYGTAGDAPNRVFIAIWSNFEMYGSSCNQYCYSTSVVLFEGSNRIFNSISNYNTCSGWNTGSAVQGLFKDATTALIVDDPVTGNPRNFGNNWDASFETVEYVPNGAGYTYSFLPGFTNFVQPTWFDSLHNFISQSYAIQYVAPDLNLIPTFISVESVQCGDTVSVDIPVELACPEFSIIGLPESCEGEQDGSIIVDITENCGDPIVWDVQLINSLGQVVSTFSNSQFPQTFSNLSTDLYTVSYSSSFMPCQEDVEVLVPVAYAKPQSHALLKDALCAGEKSGVIHFSPHGGLNENWVVDVYDQVTNNLEGTFTQSSTPIPLNGLGKGDYYVVVNSPTTCPDTLEYSLGEPEPFVFTKEEFDHNNCGTFSGFIDFDVAGGKPPYSYTINGNTAIDLKDDVVPADHYTIVAIDDNGCTITRDIDIYDKALPIVEFDMPAEVNLADADVAFTDLSQANQYSTIVSWLWEFGDTEVSYDQNPTHTYTQIGEYQVYLFATDAEGCQSFKVKTINIVSPEFYLPTIFTPNGDGQNEIFRPVIGRVSDEDYKMTIADRWGRIVYTSENIHEGWNGRDGKGNILDGSYVWIVDYKDAYSHKHHINGIVQLVR